LVRVEIRYPGELRCEATHGPSGASFVSDAPVDNNGRGESFSPTDLIGVALGTCMLTVMGIRARKEGWDMDGASVSVDKGMVADPYRRVGALDVVVRMPNALEPAARAVLEEVAAHCPVAESLSPRIDVTTRFHWGAAAAAD
jgi:putative redox protein